MKSIKDFLSKNAGGVQAGAGLASGFLNAVSPADEYGVQDEGVAGLSGALSGAAAGTAVLPGIGTAVGAVLGGVTSLIGNKKRREAREEAIAERTELRGKKYREETSLRLAMNPSLKGNVDAQMYKYGGTVKGKSSRKFSLDGYKVPSPLPDLLPDVSVAPNRILATGGTLKQLASGSMEVQGKSHAKGGVKLPQLGVELEGGETISDDYVFSKRLGFADKHKTLAKAIKKTEDMPNTPRNRKTLARLEEREENMKQEQEDLKTALGIGEGTVQYKYGGKLKKMPDGGIFPAPFYKELARRAASMPVIPGMGTINKLLYLTGKGGTKLSDKQREALRKKYEVKDTPSLRSSVAETPEIPETPGAFDPATNGNTARIPTTTSPVATSTTSAASQPAKGTKTALALPEFVAGKPGDVDVSDLRRAVGGTSETPKSPVEALANEAPEVDQAPTLTERISNIAPFVSNIANSFRKLPNPPKPTEQRLIAPNLVNMDASRAEANRQVRGANRTVRETLNSGNAAAASSAANLTQGIRAVNAVNEAEANTNAQIKNTTSAINSRIESDNIAKGDNYARELVSKQLKQQQLASENLADVGNKLQILKRDAKAENMEVQRILLTIGSDPTGSSFRSMRSFLKENLKASEFRKLEMAEKEKQVREDQINKENSELIRSLLNKD